MTYFLAKRLRNKGSRVSSQEVVAVETQNLPSFLTALVAPLVAIFLLALRPLADIKVDPLIALPLGGLIGALCMGKLRQANNYAISGLGKMAPVAIMLLGTGALAGIIANSGMKDVLIEGLKSFWLTFLYPCANLQVRSCRLPQHQQLQGQRLLRMCLVQRY